MRGRVVAVIGALVIVACIAALVEFDHRAGPYTLAVQEVVLDVPVTGMYRATQEEATAAGLCLDPPCEGPRTTIDLRFAGLPAIQYSASLEGATREDLGRLVAHDGYHALTWEDDADHADKQRMVIRVEGRSVAELALPRTSAPIDRVVPFTWGAGAGTAHFNEIGGFVVSTVVKGTFELDVPTGWTAKAWLDGKQLTDLGELERREYGWVLDARVERLALEDQERLVIMIAPDAGSQGFPVLDVQLG